eukprot:scaffold40_cov413-Prasinococcus_capsulatus_cf.AAC.10
MHAPASAPAPGPGPAAASSRLQEGADGASKGQPARRPTDGKAQPTAHRAARDGMPPASASREGRSQYLCAAPPRSARHSSHRRRRTVRGTGTQAEAHPCGARRECGRYLDGREAPRATTTSGDSFAALRPRPGARGCGGRS